MSIIALRSATERWPGNSLIKLYRVSNKTTIPLFEAEQPQFRAKTKNKPHANFYDDIRIIRQATSILNAMQDNGMSFAINLLFTAENKYFLQAVTRLGEFSFQLVEKVVSKINHSFHLVPHLVLLPSNTTNELFATRDNHLTSEMLP